MKNLAKASVSAIALGVFVALAVLLMRGRAVHVLSYWADIIGPTVYVLLPMAVILVSIVLLMAFGEMDGRFPSERELRLIEEGAPVVGLLGTVIALAKGFGHLDLTQQVDHSIKAVIGTINESLFSTAIGLAMGLIAWFVRKKVAE